MSQTEITLIDYTKSPVKKQNKTRKLEREEDRENTVFAASAKHFHHAGYPQLQVCWIEAE